jgi:hypothetical protein
VGKQAFGAQDTRQIRQGQKNPMFVYTMPRESEKDQ